MSLDDRVKHAKNNRYYALARLVRWMGRTLPRPMGVALFGLLGRAGFALPSAEKRRTLEHLAQVYGSQWSGRRIRRCARDVFVNIGRNLFDAIYLSKASDREFDRIVSCDDLDDVRRAYARGKGVIVITAHVGCFEMLLNFFGRKGFRSFAIGQRVYDPRIDRMIAAARSGENIEYLYRTENPRAILRKLGEGKVLGVLIDQDTRTDGVFAHFMGRLAYTPSGPVKMAMRYGIPAFVVTTVRTPEGRHRISIGKEFEFASTGDFDAAVVRNVEAVNARICAAIAGDPAQWVWMHRRWRRRPEEMAGVLRIDKLEAAEPAAVTGTPR